MTLLLCYLFQPIFPSCWMGWLQPVLHNSGSWITDSFLDFIGDTNFGTSPDWYLRPMWVYVVSRYSGAPPFRLIYFLALLYFHANNVSLRITFSWFFSGVINTPLLSTYIYIFRRVNVNWTHHYMMQGLMKFLEIISKIVFSQFPKNVKIA